MIALIKQRKRKRSEPAWHDAFLKMLPAITRHARIAFRYMPSEPREEAVQEVTAMCWAAFSRLVERGKQEVASPTALSRYAVAQYPGWPSGNGTAIAAGTSCRPPLNAERDLESSR